MIGWLAVTATAAHGRTLVFSDTNLTHMAVLNERSPNASWAGYEAGAGAFTSGLVTLMSGETILIKFPIDQIPKEHRIVHATLIFPVHSYQPGFRVSIWRMLVDWGAGVCHLYRRTIPQTESWAVPGAMGNGVDRASQPTITVQPKGGTIYNQLVDVTKDVELWHSGLAPNHGWMLAQETLDYIMHVRSPFNEANTWKLRVTYEPL